MNAHWQISYCSTPIVPVVESGIQTVFRAVEVVDDIEQSLLSSSSLLYFSWLLLYSECMSCGRNAKTQLWISRLVVAVIDGLVIGTRILAEIDFDKPYRTGGMGNFVLRSQVLTYFLVVLVLFIIWCILFCTRYTQKSQTKIEIWF